MTITQEADHGHPLVIALIFLLQTNCTLITAPVQSSNPEDRTNHFTDGVIKDISSFSLVAVK